MQPSPHLPAFDERSLPAQRLLLQIGIARDLALEGLPGPARRLIAGLFLDHAALLAREPELLEAFVSCVLLLQMPALLPRVLRAMFGAELDVVVASGPGERRWSLSFRGGIALMAPVPNRAASRAAREEAAAHLARLLLDAAADDPVPAPAPRPAPVLA